MQFTLLTQVEPHGESGKLDMSNCHCSCCRRAHSVPWGTPPGYFFDGNSTLWKAYGFLWYPGKYHKNRIVGGWSRIRRNEPFEHCIILQKLQQPLWQQPLWQQPLWQQPIWQHQGCLCILRDGLKLRLGIRCGKMCFSPEFAFRVNNQILSRF